MKKYIIGFIVGILIDASGVAYADDGYIQAVFAKFNFIVNGEKVDPGIDPLVYQGTSYLPVRAFANMLGYDVTYRADSRTIELSKAVPQLETKYDGVSTESLLKRLEIIDSAITFLMDSIKSNQQAISSMKSYEDVDEALIRFKEQSIEYAQQQINVNEAQKSAILEELARRGELPQTE